MSSTLNSVLLLTEALRTGIRTKYLKSFFSFLGYEKHSSFQQQQKIWTSTRKWMFYLYVQNIVTSDKMKPWNKTSWTIFKTATHVFVT